jgi:hypothetical protein
MKTYAYSLALAVLLLLAVANQPDALPRESARLISDWSPMPLTVGTVSVIVPPWSSDGDVKLSYYNYCTDWLWAVTDWEAGQRVGVVFDSDCGPGETATLVDSRVFCLEGMPSGYGFTGTMSVHDVDANLCPVDPPLSSQSWLPEGVSPWGANNEFIWNIPVGEQFAIVATMSSDQGYQNNTVLVMDHPSQVPPDPAACGYCYPTTRVARSFLWGTSANPVCPGVPMPEPFGSCDPELVFDAGVNRTVGVSERTWGRIKALYR